MKRLGFSLLGLLVCCLSQQLPAQEKGSVLTSDMCRSLVLRNVGPTLTSGRISDVAVDPRNRSIWYVASASSGVWKTTNRGMSWQSIFDQAGSYSIGCITLDPKNPNIVWVGSGENNSQRSVGFGDGVYKSIDSGKSWTNMGLKNSEHIAKIIVDPRSSEVIYVASQGPLWAPGGDRGVFKSTDGGKTWKNILHIGENTGVADLVMDMQNPDILYASAYQRRRNVGVLIGGGPESGIYKTEDRGAKWVKLEKGLPKVDKGRIGLAISPQKSNVVYAIVTASGKESGFFRSEDSGSSWNKQSDYRPQDPQYYDEIICDPNQFDRIYAMDMMIQISNDGGKRFQPQRWPIHVDHHSLTFDPDDPKHLIVGNDGGLYESYDGGTTWNHFNNLPLTQFYRVCTDNATPFYNILGGTQDNGTQGTPSRSIHRIGIRSSECETLNGGDGFQPRVDPKEPNIAYVMSQNGSLSRIDKNTATGSGIRPRGEKGVRWNWDSPLIISPFSNTRLYFAGSRLFRSDNRGDTWKAISPDLTRQLDATKIEVMGKVWGPDAVTRNTFTTALSVGSALDESPLKEGLLYFGTDDGLIQITDDGGKNWRKIEKFTDVPQWTWVSDLCASHLDVDTIYASFNNWQRGDFKPYLLKSTDRGKTWTSIVGNLPNRQPIWSVVEDHQNKNLLFVGTEFGLFFTIDGGKHWQQFTKDVPPIPFRDLEIQKREGDLVCGTFGRGFFVLDDYTPLRHLTPEVLAQDGMLCPPRKTVHYSPKSYAQRVGNAVSPNPPFGAILTYWVGDGAAKAEASLVLIVADSDGKTVRELTAPKILGIQRVVWDLRAESTGGGGGGGRRFAGGSLVKPGKYKVTLAQKIKETVKPLGEAHELELVPIP